MNCKPGIAAYIKRANAAFADCLGRIVIIIALTDEAKWRVEFVGAVPESVRSWPGNFVIADEHLIPITGLPLDEDVTEDLKVEA